MNITAIVPVYNVEQYLDKCIQSLISQTIPFDEIILIDDGSKDNSGLICDEWATKNESVRVVHQKNGGLSAARNAGINVANGDYLLFVDSDDTIDNDTIEKFEKAVDGRKADLVVANLRVVCEGEKPVDRPHSLSDSKGIISGKDYLIYELKNNTMHMASVQCLYNREFVIKNNLYFTKGLLHEDELFTPTVFMKANTVIPTGFSFYNHMMRDGSITTQKDKTRNAKSIIEICYLLEENTKELDNMQLRDLILDHCVDLYYKVFIDANLIDHRNIQIKPIFLKKHGKSLKNIIRYCIYTINKNAFTFFEKKRRGIS